MHVIHAVTLGRQESVAEEARKAGQVSQTSAAITQNRENSKHSHIECQTDTYLSHREIVRPAKSEQRSDDGKHLFRYGPMRAKPFEAWNSM